MSDTLRKRLLVIAEEYERRWKGQPPTLSLSLKGTAELLREAAAALAEQEAPEG